MKPDTLSKKLRNLQTINFLLMEASLPGKFSLEIVDALRFLESEGRRLNKLVAAKEAKAAAGAK